MREQKKQKKVVNQSKSPKRLSQRKETVKRKNSVKKTETSAKKKRDNSQFKQSQRKKKRRKLLRRDILLGVLLSIGLTVMISFFLIKLVKVSGYGMIPTLRDKDTVIVKKTKDLKRFDLVACRLGENKEEIQRIIGLPGEKIEYKKDILLVNDSPVDEKFIMKEINDNQKNGQNYTEDFSTKTLGLSERIPTNYYLVLGDNRPYTTDSRYYGLVKKENITGVVTLKLLPFNDIKRY